MRLSSGTRLGPYEIESLLGSGGMGEVYRARDTRLNRPVAIKILPKDACADPQRLQRFEREALSASALNHPNIITIYDIGKHDSIPFIAMELVEGKTFRDLLTSGQVPVKDQLNLGAQLSEGLARAHEAGIVHRDLKPENIIVNKDGLAKILDFGLAKLCGFGISSGSASQFPTSGPDTASGIVMGTIAYMSPEQASGATIDFRSDQFSLATILYEMATGHHPFNRTTAAETLVAIIREEPEPIESYNPNFPAPFIRLIRRCLSKDPAERYGSTRDLARDLRDLKEHLSASTSKTADITTVSHRKQIPLSPLSFTIAAILLLTVLLFSYRILRPAPSTDPVLSPSIAVLPFNTFGNQQEEYFSDGMTEALITELAKMKELKVSARNSVFRYKGSSVTISEVGKELGVNYVVEGSVQRFGDRIRLHAQLINAQTGYHLWAERYDRSADDLFAVQDDISANIASALKVTLSPSVPSVKKHPTNNLEAYDLYLQGRYLLNQGGEASLNRAVPLLERAIGLDPQFALAHATLGKVYRNKYFWVEPKKEWEQTAFVQIEKAIALDPTLAEAYAARGRLIWTRQNNYPHERSASDYKKAIALDPNLAEVYGYLCGIYFHVGLLEEAIQECTKGLQLDPADSLSRENRIMAMVFNQNYREALSDAEHSHAQEIWGALSLLYLGKTQESEDLVKEILRKEQESDIVSMWDESFVHSSYAVLLAKKGNWMEAEKHIRMTIAKDRGLGHFHHSEYNIASAYSLMGRTAEAMEWLQRSADHGFPCYPFFARDPHLQTMHGNPDFEAFLEKMKQLRDDYRAKLISGQL